MAAFRNDWKESRRAFWNALLRQCVKLPNAELQEIVQTLRTFAADFMDPMPAFEMDAKLYVRMGFNMLYACLLGTQSTLTLMFKVDMNEVIETGVIRAKLSSVEELLPSLREGVKRLLQSAERLPKPAASGDSAPTLMLDPPFLVDIAESAAADIAEPATAAPMSADTLALYSDLLKEVLACAEPDATVTLYDMTQRIALGELASRLVVVV